MSSWLDKDGGCGEETSALARDKAGPGQVTGHFLRCENKSNMFKINNKLPQLQKYQDQAKHDNYCYN